MLLSTYLDQAKMSAAELGRRIRTSRMAALRYVRGERMPPPEVISRIEYVTAGLVTANDCLAAYRAWRTARDQQPAGAAA